MLLKEISHYQTGTTCDLLFEPDSVKALSKIIKSFYQQKTPYFLLGSGSNSLIMDGHWHGAVICFRQMKQCVVNGNMIKAEAGVENSYFANLCLEIALNGASWMNALPGQVGATTRMNARCYGGEISNIVKSVTSITSQGEIKQRSALESFLGYKNTIFITRDEIVAEVLFNLVPGEQEKILTHMEYCKNDRIQKHQFLHPSCGCVFKNNYQANVPSGFLLENAGAEKLSTNRVQISPYHANFVFNKGATAREILETTIRMRELVYEKFGVWLEYEMEVLGKVPEDLKSRFSLTRKQCFNADTLLPLQQSFKNKQN